MLDVRFGLIFHRARFLLWPAGIYGIIHVASLQVLVLPSVVAPEGMQGCLRQHSPGRRSHQQAGTDAWALAAACNADCCSWS